MSIKLTTGKALRKHSMHETPCLIIISVNYCQFVYVKLDILQEHTYFQERVSLFFLVRRYRWRHHVLKFVLRGGHHGGLLNAIGTGGQTLVGWKWL